MTNPFGIWKDYAIWGEEKKQSYMEFAAFACKIISFKTRNALTILTLISKELFGSNTLTGKPGSMSNVDVPITNTYQVIERSPLSI